MIGIGIDTGGTYTDAVVHDLENKELLNSGKSLTTKENLETGISSQSKTKKPSYLRRFLVAEGRFELSTPRV